MNHTYAVLEVPRAVYYWFARHLRSVGYDHVFHDNREHGTVIDMHGIALAEMETPPRDDMLENMRLMREAADRFGKMATLLESGATNPIEQTYGVDWSIGREQYQADLLKLAGFAAAGLAVGTAFVVSSKAPEVGVLAVCGSQESAEAVAKHKLGVVDEVPFEPAVPDGR